MKNKFIYEILLTTQYATEEAWLNLILEIGKLNGFLKKWKIYVEIELNEVKYYVQSSVILPPVINAQSDFLIKPTNKIMKINFRKDDYVIEYAIPSNLISLINLKSIEVLPLNYNYYNYLHLKDYQSTFIYSEKEHNNVLNLKL